MFLRHDEELKRIIRKEIDDEFSYLDSNPSLHNVIMSKIEGERIVKRKVSMTLVFAIVMTIALGSMAVAASLGLFGQLRASKVDEMSYERLGLLEEAAVTVGETRRITASGVQKNAEPETVQEKLLADQMQREYDLTIDQVYCDGRKLYYSYTFKMNDDRLSMHEGEPTGFDSWGDACPGEKFEDVFDTWLGDEQNQKVSDWLNSHESGYVVKRSAFVGDGAELSDGTYLNPVDSGSKSVDEFTTTAYYEVALPEDYVAGDDIEFVLTVMASDTVYFQDETGAYMTSVFNRDAMIDVPVKVQVTGEAAAITGEGTADGYDAKATLYVSDVDITGSVRIDAPEEYEPEGYYLLADGVEYHNIDPWHGYDGEGHLINMRFDLPETMGSLVLMPLDPDYAHEAIELK